MITNLNKNKNIIISICGLNRSVNLVIKQLNKCFINYNIFYILILIKSNDKKYLNLNNKIIDYNNIKEIIYLDDIEDSSFGNSLNYSNKLSHSINIFENKYDYYFILRSDFILKNINLDMILYNKIYFSNKNINNNIICSQRINNSIIISKSYSLIKKLSKLHEYNKNNLNYLDINLFNFLNEEKINYELIKIDYKYILSRCNIIAICGDSGSGKTVLANTLNLLFKKDGLTLETDRYHKWERGDPKWKEITHLNPDANFGVYYHNLNKYYFGVSVMNLFQGKSDIYNVPNTIKNFYVRNYYLSGGATMHLKEKWLMAPSFLAQYIEAGVFQVDIGSRFIYDKKYWFGLSYRHQDAVNPMIGVNFNEIRFGYSYDITISQIKNYSFGSHELICVIILNRIGNNEYNRSAGKRSDKKNRVIKLDFKPEIDFYFRSCASKPRTLYTIVK